MAVPWQSRRAQNHRELWSDPEVLGKSSLSDAEALQQKQLGAICSINTPASWDAPEQLPAAVAAQRAGRAQGRMCHHPQGSCQGKPLTGSDTRISPREVRD